MGFDSKGKFYARELGMLPILGVSSLAEMRHHTFRFPPQIVQPRDLVVSAAVTQFATYDHGDFTRHAAGTPWYAQCFHMISEVTDNEAVLVPWCDVETNPDALLSLRMRELLLDAPTEAAARASLANLRNAAERMATGVPSTIQSDVNRLPTA